MAAAVLAAAELAAAVFAATVIAAEGAVEAGREEAKRVATDDALEAGREEAMKAAAAAFAAKNSGVCVKCGRIDPSPGCCCGGWPGMNPRGSIDAISNVGSYDELSTVMREGVVVGSERMKLRR